MRDADDKQAHAEAKARIDARKARRADTAEVDATRLPPKYIAAESEHEAWLREVEEEEATRD